MLVFIDEAGDTGRKIEKGSSKFFIISLILFDEHEEAIACDQRINLLRRELKLSDNFEFHFCHNSNKVRLKFLEAIQPYQFVYFSVIINKDPQKLWGSNFLTKESFYKYACQMVFTNAAPYLNNAIVILDRSGSSDFRNRLVKYLRQRLNNTNKKVIEAIKQQRSSSNNLLQVADYVSGIINRKVQNKADWQNYYGFVSSKEIWAQIWPK